MANEIKSIDTGQNEIFYHISINNNVFQTWKKTVKKTPISAISSACHSSIHRDINFIKHYLLSNNWEI